MAAVKLMPVFRLKVRDLGLAARRCCSRELINRHFSDSFGSESQTGQNPLETKAGEAGRLLNW